ncbi:MAG: hypothetical protein ACFFCS_22445 [Candidatus Hodarchaeota archaeon]
MPRCSQCKTNYKDKSRKEYEKAPGWDNECPNCTKKKFEKYIVEYLAEVIQKPDLVFLLNEYFNNKNIEFEENETVAQLKEKITYLVYERHAKNSRKTSTTGEAISNFVKQFDENITKYGKISLMGKNKKWVILMLISGIAIVAMSLLFWLSPW